MKIIIDIDENVFTRLFDNGIEDNEIADDLSVIAKSIRKGTPLPKGYGALYDKAEILRFLKCPKYENCDWKNCFECNKSQCINLNNLYDLAPIIEEDKSGSEGA